MYIYVNMQLSLPDREYSVNYYYYYYYYLFEVFGDRGVTFAMVGFAATGSGWSW